jgi:hypothetical protein
VSDRADEFLDRWEAEHVSAVADSEKDKEAQRLAAICLQDAARAGICEQDLKDTAGGDLVGYMLAALMSPSQ